MSERDDKKKGFRFTEVEISRSGEVTSKAGFIPYGEGRTVDFIRREKPVVTDEEVE